MERTGKTGTGVAALLLVISSACGNADETPPPVPETDEPDAQETFEPRLLDCPDGRLQAMATDLHYPDQTSCAEAARNAETSLTMAHYRRACQEAGKAGDRAAGAVLGARVARCRPDPSGGFVVDVALCCAATAPPGPADATDIWEALRLGNLTGVKRLLVDQPELADARGPGGVTLLHRATSPPLAAYLLSRGIDVNARDHSGLTPLHVAVSGRQREVAEFYVQHGADVDAEDRHGSRPLTFARTVELAALLIENGADVNGGAPLHAAAFYGADDVARLLLDSGADLEALDPNGETALHRAAFRGHLEMVRLLLDSGASASAESPDGRMPRDLVGEGPNRGAILDLLRSRGG